MVFEGIIGIVCQDCVRNIFYRKGDTGFASCNLIGSYAALPPGVGRTGSGPFNTPDPPGAVDRSICYGAMIGIVHCDGDGRLPRLFSGSAACRIQVAHMHGLLRHFVILVGHRHIGRVEAAVI